MRSLTLFSLLVMLIGISFEASAAAISHNSSRSNFSRLAGDPIPGVDVSLEQIPGGIYRTPAECVRKGGRVIHQNGKQFCQRKNSRNPQNGR